MSEAFITDRKVVEIHYTLTDDRGTEIDSSIGGEPLAYLHGEGNIVPGLERQLIGHRVGDAFSAEVSPEEGYGERNDDDLRLAPHSLFPEEMGVAPGMRFLVEEENGQQIPVWVAAIRDEGIVLDTNHPLAGVKLHFAVEVISIRNATPLELAHGHPHGPDDSH